MTDEETILRLRTELEKKNDQLRQMFGRTNDMQKKIKRQRLENGRLNKTLVQLKIENMQLEEKLRWITGD